MKLRFFFLYSAQHKFTVVAKPSHATPFQVMFAFVSMSKALIATAHTLSKSALFPRWIHTSRGSQPTPHLE
ncbi:hypothetical protein Y032_0095g2841 [Ancylostoma ceylanicum]|nr:hypothetical protein Y032_0095g2841 [Ancylostoma ceylanicum]